MSQLSVNPEHIDVDMTDHLRTTAATIELKTSDATALHLADQTGFLHGLARGDLMGGNAVNGIPFGNNPSAATSRGDEIDVGGAVGTKMERQRSELTKFLFSQGHGVFYLE